MRLRRRHVRWLIAVGVVVLIFCAATAVLFMVPRSGQPVRADAIIMFGGDGPRYEKVEELARAGLAPVVVVSDDPLHGAPCPPPVPGTQEICFHPDPYSTRGEARELGRLAAAHGWHRVILVTSTAQATRAGLRAHRCYDGHLEQISVPTTGLRWVRDILHEWAGLAEALILQRGC